jgi:hypothetical protein
MKTFAQYCTYVRKGKGVVLEPDESLGSSSWLVIFCDEINLPEEDSYGTQRVIMFMRQLVEQGESIFFVFAACVLQSGLTNHYVSRRMIYFIL